MAGYHSKEISKGVLGEITKIAEELEELKDAHEQGNKILELCELADLVGAIKFYLQKHHPDIQMSDLLIMADATDKAFKDGSRK